MEVILVRHGIAVEMGEEGVISDEGRMLSGKGRKATRQVAKGLKAAGCRPVSVISSPLLRARETADIIAEVLGLEKVEVSDLMLPGTSPTDIMAFLMARGEFPVILVGHMPDLAIMASGMLSRDASVPLTFKKAAACSILFDGEVEAGKGRLVWLMQPRQLKQMAGK